MFYCGYNIFLVKTLTQWPLNVYVARYKLLYGAIVRKQYFFLLSETTMAMMSGKVLSVFLHNSCGTVGLQSKFFAEIWVFSSGTQWLPLIGDKERHLAW